MKYSIEKVFEIKEQINYVDYIDEETIKIIDFLNSEIKNIKQLKPNFNNKNKPKYYKIKQLSCDITFQDKVKNILNKLTDKTYSTISTNIKDIITENTENTEDIIFVLTQILENALNNKLYIDTHVNLFEGLIKNYNIEYITYIDIINKKLILYDTYEYIDPDDNYSLYCKINLTNTKRLNLTLTLFNLLNSNLIQIDFFKTIIETTIDKLNFYIKESENKHIVSEIVENIYLLYHNYYTYDKTTEYFNDKIEYIKEIINEDNDELYKGISNKSIFKLEDLIEAFQL